MLYVRSVIGSNFRRPLARIWHSAPHPAAVIEWGFHLIRWKSGSETYVKVVADKLTYISISANICRQFRSAFPAYSVLAVAEAFTV
jgi:hypothetical protein